MAVVVRPVTPADHGAVMRILTPSWGGAHVVSRGRLHDASGLPGFLAELDGEVAGLTTYRIDGDQCELVTLDASVPRRGVGRELVGAVVTAARVAGCDRLWLVTTNDNVDAVRFYVRCGLRLVAVHLDALAESRRHKPSIPLIGRDGVAVRDEWELELRIER